MQQLLKPKPKLRELFEPDWYRKLEPFLLSDMFQQIGRDLKACKKEVSPRFEDTFRAFKECPWSKLNVVIMGLSPYPGKYQNGTYVADGLAFSSRDSIGCPKSLEMILTAIDKEVYGGEGYHLTKTFDLVRWARQGVLLLNCALSYPLGEKSDAHVNLWYRFISYVVQLINDEKDSISFLLLGSEAQKHSGRLTNATFQVLTAEHPSYAVRQHRTWNDGQAFSQIDGFQKFQNNNTINW